MNQVYQHLGAYALCISYCGLQTLTGGLLGLEPFRKRNCHILLFPHTVKAQVIEIVPKGTRKPVLQNHIHG